MDYIAMLVGWCGTLLVGHGIKLKPLGWILWLMATMGWLYIGITHHILGLTISSIGYLILEGTGLIKSIIEQKRKL